MKNIFVILFFLAGQNFLFAQGYIPLPDTNAKWITVLYVSPNCMNYGCPYSYTYNSDTIINFMKYKKIKYTNYSSPQNPQYSGAIRQDTNARKVYYIPPSYSNEYLLYNFSLNIGDTITSYVYPDGLGPLVPCHSQVYFIDSVLIKNKYRKRLHFNSDCPIGQWMEGIGSDAGLLEPFAYGVASFQLWCFEHMGKVLYPSPDTIYSSCDSSLLFVTEQNIFSQKVVDIFPNPFSSNATIFLNQPFLSQTFNITFFSVLGKEITKIKLISSETKLDSRNLSLGIYFYKVRDENGNIKESGKIIIQ